MKIIECYPYVNPHVPFNELKPQQITFYLHQSNLTGHNDGSKKFLGDKKTCGSACQGCYFKNLPPYEIPLIDALQITSDLRAKGYDVGIVNADMASDQSLYGFKKSGSAFRLNHIARNNGIGWTSGYLLSKSGWEKRLEQAWNVGYGAITISLYGVVHSFPINGVPKPETVKMAIMNINTWNESNPDKKFKLVTTARIFPNTKRIDALRKTADWCLQNKVDVLRWNAQANFLNLPQHIQLELKKQDIYDFYTALATLQKEYMYEPISFGISEDIGPHGIEQVLPWLSDEWKNFTSGSNYWCRAGYRLFSINRVHEQIVVTGCVDKWAPVIGKIEKFLTGWEVIWNYELIEKLRVAILNGDVYGCHGGVGYQHNGRDNGFKTNLNIQKSIYG